ncbi:immunity 7 family protein [Kribbella sp. NBC_01245]|uniref:Imm7 family immunity protein n=1 Tax=Kribbella sp. NBC_01245 TaxID=2903578 RepID=UPI002E28CC58|nr:Imm7 family immunity protein [Kribbella sp. NBC_01245]
MFEYHGWATVRDSSEAVGWVVADGLTKTAYDTVAGEIAAITNDFQVADLRIVNGSCHLWLAGLRNHRQDAVIETFHSVARAAPWSYGILHVYDDEAPGDGGNRWVAWVMKRGMVTPQADQFLSPHVGAVEDPEHT